MTDATAGPPADDPPDEHDVTPARRQERLEILAETFSVSPASDPVAERIAETLTPEHVTSLIANADAAGRRKHEAGRQREWVRLTLAGLALAAVIGLCWLLLAYGATDHLDAIITAAIGLAGGFGLGRASSK